MSVPGLARTFWSWPASKRRLALEAAAELVRAAMIVALPPRYLHRELGDPVSGEERDARSGGESPEEAWLIGRIVERVALRMPFRAVCLAQAIASRRMLRRRGLEARLVLGVDPERFDPTDEFGAPDPAHAWVWHGSTVVSGGGADLDRFAVIGQFP